MPNFTEDIEFADRGPDYVGEAEDKVRAAGGGRQKFAQEVQKALQREDRESVQRSEKAIAPVHKDEETGLMYREGRVFIPQCHVCQHPYRDWIEMMLIKGATYKGLQERVPPLEGHSKLDRRSISNHYQKHMDLQDAAFRAILEREATLQNQDFAEGVEDAITKRGVLEIMLRKGYEDILNGVTTVEARDLIQLAKVLGDMDANQNMVAVDELRGQVQIFIQAIKNVCDIDTQAAIANEVKRLRSRENIETKFESVMQPEIPEAVVVLEEPVEISSP